MCVEIFIMVPFEKTTTPVMKPKVKQKKKPPSLKIHLNMPEDLGGGGGGGGANCCGICGIMGWFGWLNCC